MGEWAPSDLMKREADALAIGPYVVVAGKPRSNSAQWHWAAFWDAHGLLFTIGRGRAHTKGQAKRVALEIALRDAEGIVSKILAALTGEVDE